MLKLTGHHLTKNINQSLLIYQLIVMTLIEIVLFVGNEVIGRQKLGAVDAGDTIFVHLFGAYFGLAVSRVLHYKNADHHKNQASSVHFD